MPEDLHSQGNPDEPETYAIDACPATPKLPGQVNHQASKDAAIDALTHDLSSHATECIRRFGDFHIALPGGTQYESCVSAGGLRTHTQTHSPLEWQHA